MQLRDFYKGKKIFITGHTGFKGTWLTLLLKEFGASLSGFSLSPIHDESGILFDMLDMDKEIDSIFGDIRNLEELKAAMLNANPDIVFHLAAQPLVRFSYDEPVETYEANVMGTVNVLEVIRKAAKARVCVVVTTDKCYENLGTNIVFEENDRLGGYDPYSSSKACVELVTSAYRSSFLNEKGINVATARAGNVIGGGDFACDRIISDIVSAIRKDVAVVLRYPKSIRPWQYVLDPLVGYIILAFKLYGEGGKKYASSYNFAPDSSNHCTVLDITKRFIEKFGQGKYVVDETNMKLHEAKTLKLSNKKAQSELEWHPIIFLNQTIDATTSWYKRYLEGRYDMKSYTKSQINSYLSVFEMVAEQ